MWKYLGILILAVLFAFTSCATTGEKKEDGDGVSIEKEKAAMELLTVDMFSSLSSFSFDSLALADALPDSFTIYKEYVPSYDALEKKYLSEVKDVAVEAVESYMPVIKNMAFVLSGDPLPYIPGDTTFTKELERRLGGELSKVIYEKFLEESSCLEESFLSVARIFNEIRSGYASLSSVGKGEYLPEAESIVLEKASMIVSTEFFLELGKEETILKNTPVSSNSPYSVFWE